MPSHFIHAWQWLNVAPEHDKDLNVVYEGELGGREGGKANNEQQQQQERQRLLGGNCGTTTTDIEQAASARAAESSPARTGTLSSSVLILISSVFGSSILAVPYAYAQCGWALGLICLVACLLITLLGARLLLECATRLQQKYSYPPEKRVTYSQIAAEVTPKLAFLPEMLVVLNCLGSAVAALVVAGDIMPSTFLDIEILEEKYTRKGASADAQNRIGGFLKHRYIWVTIILCLVLPLCFLRSITPLRHAGLVTFVSVVYFVLTVAILWFVPSTDACQYYTHTDTGTHTCALNVTAFPSSDLFQNLLLACPIFFFSFSINFQILPIYNALTHPSTRTTAAAAGAALTFSGGVYMCVCVCAYFLFGQRVLPNLFRNLPNTIMVDMARILMHFVIMLLYPLVLFTARASLMNLLGPTYIETHLGGTRRCFYILTFFLLVLTYTLALLFTDLSVIVGCVGALATVPISLTLPAFYLIYFLREKGEEGVRGGLWVCVGVGVLMTGLFLYGTFATVQ